MHPEFKSFTEVQHYLFSYLKICKPCSLRQSKLNAWLKQKSTKDELTLSGGGALMGNSLRTSNADGMGSNHGFV